MIKKGFTLAEVLITLAILGVVAALTIPGLIANTQGRQYSVAYKKAVATFGQAINKSVAIDGVDMSNLSDAKFSDTNTQRYPNGMVDFIKQNFNVQRSSGTQVYLADGTMFDTSGITGATSCSAAVPCVVGVDVNGDASPNANYNTTAKKLTDRFLMIVTDVTAMPYATTIVNPDTGVNVTVENANLPFTYSGAAAAEAANFAMTGKKYSN